jgi:hypothetical protein
VIVGDIVVKASSVDRKASLARLQKKLGKFREPEAAGRPRPPEPLKAGQPKWDEYIFKKRLYIEDKEAQFSELAKRLKRERLELARRQKEKREAVLRGSWVNRSLALNAMRSVLAAEQASEKSEQRLRQKRERMELHTRSPRIRTISGLAELQQTATDAGWCPLCGARAAGHKISHPKGCRVASRVLPARRTGAHEFP